MKQRMTSCKTISFCGTVVTAAHQSMDWFTHMDLQWTFFLWLWKVLSAHHPDPCPVLQATAALTWHGVPTGFLHKLLHFIFLKSGIGFS